MAIFHRNRKSNPKIHMKPQKTLDKRSDTDKKEQSCFQTVTTKLQ